MTVVIELLAAKGHATLEIEQRLYVLSGVVRGPYLKLVWMVLPSTMATLDFPTATISTVSPDRGG